MNNADRDMQNLPDEGVTLIGPLPISVEAFYRRLIEDGLRVSTEPVRPRAMTGLPGDGLTIAGPGCRGYLLGRDGEEAAETDLYAFLLGILREGEGVAVSGKYVQPGGATIESDAQFLVNRGLIMSAERRVLLRPDGQERVLRLRSDISQDNVTPFSGGSGPRP